MWENEHKKTVIRNIAAVIVLVLAVTGLLAAMIVVRKQINAEDEQLRAANSSQRQELSNTRLENLEAIEQAYAVDLRTVEQFLPGIVCWGDSLTAGSSGNVSYPYTLQKYLNTYLCDIYDFRSTIENAESYGRLKWDNYKFYVPVINMGAGQEDSVTILGRSGAVPYVICTDFVIPADTESVTVKLQSADGRSVSPLTAGSVGINPVTISGVTGTLTLTADEQGWNQNAYRFTRLEAGDEVPVAAGTEVITAASDAYTDYIHIVWLGTYGKLRKPENLVEDVRQLLARQTKNTDRYLVLGPCTVSGTWSLGSTDTLDDIDAAMLQAFGNHYVNVRKYLIEDGLRDAKITATKADSDSLHRGFVPDSFRSNAGGADLNGIAYTLVGKLVYERLERLGYFREVCEELNLDATTQEILRKDPTYFEKMLKVN